jgi:HPr kinase/phosphorylase
VATFIEAGREALALELTAGSAGLRRRIVEATMNRPGLALSGFLRHFARRRVQVVGLAEQAYLASLPAAERERRLRRFFARKIPCVVLTRGKKAFPEMARLAEEYRVPLLKTKQVTKHFINAATIIMENLTAPRMNVQGTMVEIMGIGVLLEGPAGIGKSETALGLIKEGHALVSDDVTALRLDSAGNLIGGPMPVTRFHMEIRGLGIIHVPSLFGVASVREEKKLDLVATLFAAGTRTDATPNRLGT